MTVLLISAEGPCGTREDQELQELALRLTTSMPAWASLALAVRPWRSSAVQEVDEVAVRSGSGTVLGGTHVSW